MPTSAALASTRVTAARVAAVAPATAVRRAAVRATATPPVNRRRARRRLRARPHHRPAPPTPPVRAVLVAAVADRPAALTAPDPAISVSGGDGAVAGPRSCA